MNRIIEIIFILLLTSFVAQPYSRAETINIPADQSTIQAGIDASADGDTVLVAPGTYYENLELTGKNITLASHYIPTLDTMYVHETIIDGNNSGSVIKIINEYDATAPILIGFTIQNGAPINRHSPSEDTGNGIRCIRSNPLLERLVVKNNYCFRGGGGLLFVNSNPVIKDALISDNG